MITIHIKASDDSVYKRISYVMRQILIPIGYKFAILRDMGKVNSDYSIACVPDKLLMDGSFQQEFDLVIPYGDYTPFLKDDANIKVHEIDGVPILYAGEKPEFLIRDRKVGFDLINAVFYLLSRQEEYNYGHRDLRDRFVAFYSVLYEHGILQIPVINYYISFIEQYINSRIQGKPEPKWKGGAPYAVVLSHDLDSLPSGDITIPLFQIPKAFQTHGFASKLGHLKNCLRDILIYMSSTPNWQLSYWLDKESEYDFRSTFFVASNTTNRDRSDPAYWLHSKLVYDSRKQHLFEVVKFIEDSGWEIGLHGSYNTFQDENLLYEEKKQFIRQSGCDIKGIRNHYLRFDVRKTWKIQESLGFAYDTTLGYSECNGFRVGIAFPFTPYDLQNEREYNLLELPLSVMDGSFFEDYGERLEIKKSIQRCERLFNAIEETGGMLVVNFHLNFCVTNHPDSWALYEYVLKRSAESGAWVTTGREIAEWWIERQEGLMINV
jgi:peptidoglycan/xylan/chitin deacetylase (PgdA/CDA1 family)